jgi:hypothetical protein
MIVGQCARVEFLFKSIQTQSHSDTSNISHRFVATSLSLQPLSHVHAPQVHTVAPPECSLSGILVSLLPRVLSVLSALQRLLAGALLFLAKVSGFSLLRSLASVCLSLASWLQLGDFFLTSNHTFTYPH